MSEELKNRTNVKYFLTHKINANDLIKLNPFFFTDLFKEIVKHFPRLTLVGEPEVEIERKQKCALLICHIKTIKNISLASEIDLLIKDYNSKIEKMIGPIGVTLQIIIDKNENFIYN